MLAGSALWHVGARRFHLERDALLVLNHGTAYALERRADEPSRSFCVFIARGFVEEARRALVAGDAALLDRPRDAARTEYRTHEQLHAGTPRVAERLRGPARAIAAHEVTPHCSGARPALRRAATGARFARSKKPAGRRRS